MGIEDMVKSSRIRLIFFAELIQELPNINKAHQAAWIALREDYLMRDAYACCDHRGAECSQNSGADEVYIPEEEHSLQDRLPGLLQEVILDSLWEHLEQFIFLA